MDYSTILLISVGTVVNTLSDKEASILFLALQLGGIKPSHKGFDKIEALFTASPGVMHPATLEALETCLQKRVNQLPKGISMPETTLESPELTLPAPKDSIEPSDRLCAMCEHYDLDTSDDDTGLGGGGPMCLLDEDGLLDLNAEPSIAVSCPFFKVQIKSPGIPISSLCY